MGRKREPVPRRLRGGPLSGNGSNSIRCALPKCERSERRLFKGHRDGGPLLLPGPAGGRPVVDNPPSGRRLGAVPPWVRQPAHRKGRQNAPPLSSGSCRPQSAPQRGCSSASLCRSPTFNARRGALSPGERPVSGPCPNSAVPGCPCRMTACRGTDRNVRPGSSISWGAVGGRAESAGRAVLLRHPADSEKEFTHEHALA